MASINFRLSLAFYHLRYERDQQSKGHTALMSLVAAAVSFCGGFFCMFSTSEEYETALIMERRAQGRYDQPRSRWSAVHVRRRYVDGSQHGATT